MKLTITIKMDGTAFEPDNGTEAARILRELANTLDGGNDPAGAKMTLRDVNGNRVGEAKVTK